MPTPQPESRAHHESLEHRTHSLVSRQSACAAVLSFALLAFAAAPSHASPFTLAASGTISFNNTSDTTLPAGTPWSLAITYDTAAPDLDFEVAGSADPGFGRFTNTDAVPALLAFHYQAGSYEVTLDDPTDFATGSNMVITFSAVNAIDINLFAPGLFPPLAGGSVSFHADFNAVSTNAFFANDGLPTNTALGPESFDQNAISLLPSTGGVITGSTLTTFSITAPEPSLAALALLGLAAALPVRKRFARGSDSGRATT